MTENQKKLADLLIATKTEAKVRRREQLVDGSYRFYEVVRPTSPIDFAREGEFALKLHEKNPTAPLSPIYINLRNLPEDLLKHMGLVLAEITKGSKADFCAGIPDAGVPIARAYAAAAGMEIKDVLAKAETKEGRRIVKTDLGHEKELTGKRVRLIDDLVTQADTKLEAIRAAEEAGLKVADIVVLVDREQGGAKQLAEAGYQIRAAFKLSQLLDYYLMTGQINRTKYDRVNYYLTNSASKA
ncbi:MAG TPA: phosphoribosyltransferase family protein [Candidatus Woesebacteria bacterium]|nr:phosphoribosyltransferase family protein [Candidatus Woesebacteria bacterium]HRS22779.1 phosphoribosyltransferase family protein [Candidatus Woesebacteria bacterium]HRT39732.1 phosphoribosyltransferase family protein [Candidatus Woesebacteria bacterium]